MVWFKYKKVYKYSTDNNVSIPLWYDSNLIVLLVIASGFVFSLNSTMVWFKLDWMFVYRKFTHGLNSTMVWFKYNNPQRWFTSDFWSQFHYGMIQILIISYFYYCYSFCLNSTMVWFKCVYVFRGMVEGKKSQFHYGMIQIESLRITSGSNVESQFHYGMIQIIIIGSITSNITPVSIPLWYDSNIRCTA